MSSRVTRASARKSADQTTLLADAPDPTPTAPRPQPSSRKRKASAPTTVPDSSIPADSTDQPNPPKRRRRIPAEAELPSPPVSRKRKHKSPTMSASGGPSEMSDENNTTPGATASSSKRKSGKSKKPSAELSSTSPPLVNKRNRPSSSKKRAPSGEKDKSGEPVAEADSATSPDGSGQQVKAEDASDGSDDEDAGNNYDEDPMDEDPFASSFLRRHGGSVGISNTLRALSGMMSGMTSRLRSILENLKQRDDPSAQLIALQELSELLLVSTEDNLAGHFSPDQYVKELVTLMQPGETGEPNPEMMLLACRCIANMMEALPASTATVVYGGAVPILCEKLLEIQFIDLAEQALTTLEKISVEFPASIVREGGLSACLQYLEFFPTSVQRSAVITAANCCRNIPEESFDTVCGVMVTLLDVLRNSDQKVVEQGCLCVSRIVESFKYEEKKLEKIIGEDLLKIILRLLLPGSTNMIGPTIHTQFLRVLSITARASPKLTVALMKMNVVDTLYQILTGVSPPSKLEDAALKIDSVVIMQALIHRPREQIFETLNVICELLPGLDKTNMAFIDELVNRNHAVEDLMVTRSRKPPHQKRIEALGECKEELRRFAVILLPTLTDAYSSTVNLSVRQKVLIAQLKMLSFLDADILQEALRSVPYASFLAAILSQQDHVFLVTCALQAAELLLKRLGPVYRYQFYREGVMAEIQKLADRKSGSSDSIVSEKPQSETTVETLPPLTTISTGTSEEDAHPVVATDGTEDEGDDEDEDVDDLPDIHDDHSGSSQSSPASETITMPPATNIQDSITRCAKKFMDMYSDEKSKELDQKALEILETLKILASDISECYETGDISRGAELFSRLARYFEGDALESITSYELLTSKIVGTLLDIFHDMNGGSNVDARSAFVEVFMSASSGQKIKTASSQSPATPFSVLVHKLQDLLSRAEHFEVTTVHQNAHDTNRSSAASMLAKQIRLKLVADDDSGIPRMYRNVMVSIHAIATFKALDDYLRPRISLAENPRAARNRDLPMSVAAQYAAALTGLSGSDGPGSYTGSLSLPSQTGPLEASAHKTPQKKSSKKSPATASGSDADAASSSTPVRQNIRRSSRKSKTANESNVPSPSSPLGPPLAAETQSQSPLECPDEEQLLDDQDMDLSEALDTIVGDIDEEAEDEEDPSAVNMEVASTGKIAARQEDGTRIATPVQSALQSQTSTPARPPNAGRPMPSHIPQSLLSSLAGRPGTYSAAVQAVPQDWHLEFSVNGKPIANETTIYRAVHTNQPIADDTPTRNIWSAVHSICIKKVSGPPSAEPSSLNPASSSLESDPSEMPLSLEKNPVTAEILRLLQILHEMNANLDDVLMENDRDVKINPEPLAQFVNTKLTAKLNRQLEEPLVVASNCLPSWSEDLARLYPFLFPFETRHLFLQSTSFGYSRSMSRWQSQQSANESRRDRHRDERPFLGRLQRQKVRLQREKLFESAVKVMELYGASPSVLEVEYFDEVGTGLGPTLEFYSSVSREFSKKKLRLWRENESGSDSEYAFGSNGLFPAPMSEAQAKTESGQRVLQLFKILGKFVARSMLDSRIIDVSFNPNFFRISDSTSSITPSMGAVKAVDADLAKSLQMLKQYAIAKKRIEEQTRLTSSQKAYKVARIEYGGARVEDLGLDFTLPGYPIELIPNGTNTAVTIENIGTYIDRVIDFTLGEGVQRQIEAFRTGFSQVFPYSALWAFTPDELVMLFGMTDEDWSMENLMDSIKADHGYNLDSKSVRNLLQVMSELTLPERREFLQFVTGSPKLPIGGFKSLTPMFTVVCKPSEPPYTSDDYLPSVMTCVNYLKMPDYTSVEIMRERLKFATKEGQGAFHLS